MNITGVVAGVTAVNADLRDPAGVLAHPELQAVIDLARPTGIVLGVILHFLDADAARAVTGGYTRLIAPGSCLIFSVARYDDEMLGKRLSAECTAASWHNHAPSDVVSFFAGLELVRPGGTDSEPIIGAWPLALNRLDTRSAHDPAQHGGHDDGVVRLTSPIRP